MLLRRWLLLKGTRNCPIKKAGLLLAGFCGVALIIHAIAAPQLHSDVQRLSLESRAVEAENTSRHLYDVLEGRVAMFEPIENQYGQYAVCSWTLYTDAMK